MPAPQSTSYWIGQLQNGNDEPRPLNEFLGSHIVNATADLASVG